MEQFISIDIGTTVFKAAIFDVYGNQIHSEQYKLDVESEHTPLEWVQSFEKFINDSQIFLQQSTNTFIVISGHGPSTIFLNSRGEVLSYTSWQSKKKVVNTGEKSYYLPQIAYMYEKHPDVFRSTHLVLPPAEYLSYLLTGEKMLFIPNTSFLPYMWDKSHCARYRLSYSFLPPPINSGEIIGKADGVLGKKLKLREYTVISGGLDYLSAILGSGTIKRNKIFLRCGSSVMMNCNIEKISLTTVNRNLPKAIIKPTFMLPSLIEKYINIAYSIPYFDQLYQSALLHLNPKKETNLLNEHYEDYSLILQSLPSDITECVKSAIEGIFENNYLFKDITNYFTTNLQRKKLGISFLALLLHLTKTICNELNALVGNNVELESDITASGGHANDIVLMKLIADNLNATVSIFDPVHTELIGNYYLGKNPLAGQRNFRKKLPTTTPAKTYHPKNT